ncbi:GNAT family N-acetyltransferase [Streptococcus pacificus]|uniref:GNAT family N-acetyltransferase n=1 Tax=Streptococcus pacificus TaxID=2740577 RepID=A0ABS0ZI17_9STRE|nr:GNAT family N-acetyltransferase [Streptococcus pacificus]MBJ8325640.1 GNAT family N-acetyltransferase [Streptococcus pacificus]
MDDIRTLRLSDEKAFNTFNHLLTEEKEAGNPFIETRLIDDYSSFYQKTKQLETLSDQPDWSTVTSYYYFRNQEILAKISCRWELEKGNLSEIGGHIGYATLSSYRRQGIVTKLLFFAFERYKERHIYDIFITALEDNIASRRAIEKVGGKLQDIITTADGKKLARYWINLERITA